jgi:ribulose-phosphate 3-epimerase
MIKDPEKYIGDFVDAESDIITVHVEATTHLHRTIGLIKENKVKAGVSLNPATPLSSIEYIIRDIDLLLIMTVNPGFGGQKFIENMIAKIKAARKMIDDISPNVMLEVDGGVTTENIGTLKEAGTDIFVAGSSVFKSGDYAKTIRKMKDIANS